VGLRILVVLIPTHTLDLYFFYNMFFFCVCLNCDNSTPAHSGCVPENLITDHFFFLLFVRNSLEAQELLNAPVAIEAAESTRLCTAMRQSPLIVHGHGVDMNSPAVHR
jgi:hypothetical protein